MIKCNGWRVAVCSWSLKDDLESLAKIKEETGVSGLHLMLKNAIGPDGEEFINDIKEQGWDITATAIGFDYENYSTLDTIRATSGIVHDECWLNAKDIVISAIEKTAQLEVPFMSFHVGFLGQENETALERTKFLADIAAEKNIILILETGQEEAEIMKEFLGKLDHPAVGVNFDPANTILYGRTDPIAELNTLSKWIKHVHIKDAVTAKVPGTWGSEVPWTAGEVDTEKFFSTLKSIGFTGDIAVEREAGVHRYQDIKFALNRLRKFQI